MKKHIITLTGDLASGKSTIARMLCDNLNYEYYSNGAYFRSLAKDYGMDLTEFSIYVKNHPEIDLEIEEKAKSYALGHDNLLIDARLGFYVVPDSFKIYLKVDIDEAAKRAFNDDKRKDVENFSSIDEYKKELIFRSEEENYRYKKLYNIDKNDLSNYDLVVDTTSKSVSDVVKLIEKEYEKWLNN